MSVISKSEARSFYKGIREGFPHEAKSDLDRIIAEKLFDLDEYKNRDTLLAFVSKGIEVDTSAIIAKAFSDGKTVAVPRCDSESNTMTFYVIKSRGDLESGYFGLLEPKTDCQRLDSFEGSICLVPGLCYDANGYRVGFGKGFYDRFLNDYTGVSVGVCYSECIAEKLPKDEFDRPVDILITDNRIYRKDKGYG